MKHHIFFLLFLATPLFGISQTWNLLGPDTANISRIDFTVALQYHVLSADDGFYLYHYGNNTYEYFTYSGLPVTGAAYYNNDKILITMGNGSYSDGIYTFDVNTHQFEVLEYVVWPAFLHYNYFNAGFWVGSEWGGLLYSEDGSSWTPVENFTAFPCVIMASHSQNLVVQVISDLTNGYWSDDGGENWSPSEIAPGFSKMAFHYDGDILGVFSGYSNSSGLWKSVDQGNSWEVEIYQDNMSSVCYDVFSEILVGFDGEGLGMYSPGSGVTMLQNNPPNMNINTIQVNPAMSAPAIFVSTDEGVYYSYDYYVGMDEDENTGSEIQLSPNPAGDIVNITSDLNLKSIQLINTKGQIIYHKNISGTKSHIDVSVLASGTYVLQLETEKGKSQHTLVVK